MSIFESGWQTVREVENKLAEDFRDRPEQLEKLAQTDDDERVRLLARIALLRIEAYHLVHRAEA